jgi:diguanylate cyclase (GGDEF)-like protein
MLAASAVLAIPAASASVYRSVNIGWQWVMALHIAAAIFLLVLLIFRKSIPYNVRAGSIVCLFLFVGLSGFWEFGMIAGANPMLLISPVLATVLFGKRLGIFFAVAMVFMMMLTAYSFIYGGRVFNIDFSVSETFLPAWTAYLLTVILVVATSIAGISMSNRHLASALNNSRNSQIAIMDLNRNLENQVSERTLELEEARLKAEQQARTDVLTGLNNRRAFFEYAEIIDAQSRRYNHSYIIAMIDIDHFKSVNDTWGHEAGNATLVVVGGVISGVLRETDIIGRIGGEEFGVILPETSIKEGTLLAERLREAVEGTKIQTANGEVNVTISIGIASFDDTGDTLNNVVANSDAAMYQAKNTGRNRIELH